MGEYRVWLNPARGARPFNGDQDYMAAFATYESAEAFSKHNGGAEEPLVLVRQREWINEPEPGKYVPEKGERLTEWQVGWLQDSKRNPDSIQEFLKHPQPAKAEKEGDDEK
jgi:putative acetyltransferase